MLSQITCCHLEMNFPSTMLPLSVSKSALRKINVKLITGTSSSIYCIRQRISVSCTKAAKYIYIWIYKKCQLCKGQQPRFPPQSFALIEFKCTFLNTNMQHLITDLGSKAVTVDGRVVSVMHRLPFSPIIHNELLLSIAC